MAALFAIAGPLRGAIFQLAAEEVLIGRLSTSHLCIGDPSVSRRHCVIQPEGRRFRVRDLNSNNGTFVNGTRVEEQILREGDSIGVGDTLFQFVEKPADAADGGLLLADNGIVAHSAVRWQASDLEKTATVRSPGSAAPSGDLGRWARSLLQIGAALNNLQELAEIEDQLLKQILQIVPAEQAAIVLLPANGAADLSVTGRDRRHGKGAPVAVSRALVMQALQEKTSIFSDDVAASQESWDPAGGPEPRVQSVIVVVLQADGPPTGVIYLDSSDPIRRLQCDHLEFVSAVAEFAGPVLERARQLHNLEAQNQRLQTALQLEHNLVGTSSPMRQISERIAKIARTDATVLIRGETGTGKELAARAIHDNSSRAPRPFEAVNCAMLRDALLESELFGHEKGAFTGAVAQHRGKLEAADGGTLFLDELAELGETTQAMLLRFLQTREFQRLGGTRTIRVNIRIIAATNGDLEQAIRAKTFRQDLYYRVGVVSLTMPPLRDRLEDIPMLAHHFLQIYSRKNKRFVRTVSPAALVVLQRYDWPGNVRELENAIEYAVVFGSTDELLAEDLPEAVCGGAPGGAGGPLGYHDALREAKRNIVLSALQQASGNYGEAARILGIHVNNLHRLIRELEVKSRNKA